MELKILEEVQTHYQQEVIDFNWEPVRKNPKRYGVLYPITGYFVSLISVRFISLGVFMWLFLIGGAILFFGGVYSANGMMGEYKKNENSKGGRPWRSLLILRNVRAVERVRRVVQLKPSRWRAIRP
jgi:hypothetical protein